MTTYDGASVGGHQLSVRPATGDSNAAADKPRKSKQRRAQGTKASKKKNKCKQKQGRVHPQIVSHSDKTAHAAQTACSNRTDSSNFRPPWVQFNAGMCGSPRQSHDEVLLLESRDLATTSRDCHMHASNLITAVVESSERLCVVDQSVESVEVDSALGDDSSLEWDEELLRNPISFRDTDVLIPHPKFPNMDPSSWETILRQCSGRGSWFERFASVCSDASLVVTNVCSACHLWAKIDDKVHTVLPEEDGQG